MVKRFLVIAGVALALAACQDQRLAGGNGRSLQPIPPATLSLMAQKGMSKSDPILMRVYKRESELELWKKGRDGRYALLKTYPICRWSGQLGPKTREGDRQAPEGFYTVGPAQMNPNSAYYLSFDTGYPNAYDRSLGHTGAQLMVHGTCSSRGCYAMTDEAIAEVYAVAREAFAGGQRGFQFQAYPFRMTAENMAKFRADPNIAFWKNLKEGADYFNVTREEPKVAVCGRRYTFGDPSSSACAPHVDPAVAEKSAQDEREVAALVAKGTPAIRLVYEDGGQHQSFRSAALGTSGDGVFAALEGNRPSRNLGDVSRPEALAAGPHEIVVDGSGKPKAPATALAFASAKPAEKAAEPRLAAAEAKPALATPRATAFASAAPAPSEPSASPALPTDKPLYERLFTDIFGGSETAAVQDADPAAQPASAPLPPRKASATGGKPHAAASHPDRRVELRPVGATGSVSAQ